MSVAMPKSIVRKIFTEIPASSRKKSEDVSLPVPASFLVNDYQEIKDKYKLRISKLPDYGHMMKYVDDFHNQVEFYNTDNIHFDFDAIRSESMKEVRHMHVYNKLVSDMIKNYRYKCLQNCDTKDLSITSYIASGIQGAAFRGAFAHRTVKRFSVKYGNSIGEVPMVVKILDDDGVSNYKCEIIHEAAIGIALNSISHMTPNFMHFYGLLPCDLDYNFADPSQSNICKSTEYPGFPVYEFIDGVTLEKWLSSRTTDMNNDEVEYDIKCVMAQIFLSLAIANEMVEYTHFDLHDSNVMVIDMGETKRIEYELPNGSYTFMDCRYLAKIIDYGRNYAKVDKQEMFKDLRGLEFLGVDCQSNHQFDIVRLCLYCYYVTDYTKLYEILSDLIADTLSEDDLQIIMNGGVRYYNHLKYEDRKKYEYSGYALVAKLFPDMMYYDGNIEYDYEIFNDFIKTDNAKSKMTSICISETDMLNRQRRRIINLLLQNKKKKSKKNMSKLEKEINRFGKLITTIDDKNIELHNMIVKEFDKL